MAGRKVGFEADLMGMCNMTVIAVSIVLAATMIVVCVATMIVVCVAAMFVIVVSRVFWKLTQPAEGS